MVGSLHRTAARWFEEHGYVVEAVRHAQAAGDWAHAARLLADNYVGLVFDGPKATLRALLTAFPAERPRRMRSWRWLSPPHGSTTACSTKARTHIAVAERLAATVPDERRQIFDLRLASAGCGWRLSAAISRPRSRRCGLCRGAPGLRACAQQRPSRLGADELGIAELWSLHLDDARRDLEEALALARRIGRPYLEVGCLGHLAVAAVWSGSPIPEALRLSEDAVRSPRRMDGGRIASCAGRRRRRGALAWLGRFDEAEQWLDRVERAQPPTEELETEPVLHQPAASCGWDRASPRRR